MNRNEFRTEYWADRQQWAIVIRDVVIGFATMDNYGQLVTDDHGTRTLCAFGLAF